MWHVVKEHPRAFVYALIAHLILVAMLVFSLDWTPKPTAGGAPPTEAVQAVVIDASKVDAEVQRLQDDQQREEQEAAERVKQLEEKAQRAEAKREQEQRRLEDLKQKQTQETKRIKEQEAKRKLEEQKQAETKAKAAADAKAKAAVEAQAKVAADAKAKAEADAKARADAKAKADAARKAAEQALQDQVTEELNQGIINQYGGLIVGKVQRNWIQPPSYRVGLSCVVQVQLMPGGEVASVQIVQSSGDAAFDRSVETAVYRASPLPLPAEPGLFDNFRTMKFIFAPK